MGNAGVRMPRSEKKVQAWVEQVALQTALCLLKSAEPELQDLDFDEVTGKGMQKALSDVVFERVPTPHERLMALLVEVKCPCSYTHNLPLLCLQRNLTYLVQGPCRTPN